MSFTKRRIDSTQIVTSVALLSCLCSCLGCGVESTSTSPGDGDADSGTDTDTETESEDDDCTPGDTYCEDDTVMECGEDGTWSAEEDCTASGMECAGGDCVFVNPCEEAAATSSNIGCEYWAVDLDNAQNSIDDAASGQFAVAVANIGSSGMANVAVQINEAAVGEPLSLVTVEEHTVEELGVYVFLLPRRDVDGGNFADNHVDDGPQTRLSADAFRITSDVPVVAYQFNTLDQQFSNDASLLLPTSGLGKDHVVLGLTPSGPTNTAMSPKNRGYVTIVGVQENTTVTVTPTFDIVEGEGIAAIAAGTPTDFTIGPFEVVNLETELVTLADLVGGAIPDLTGTTVISDAKVAVFFGTDLSLVSNDELFSDSCCAEHLEEQVLPSAVMAQKFVVSHSAQRNSGAMEQDFYRIMAYQGATVTTTLPSPNDSFTLAPGEYREFFTNQGFIAQTADGYLHVAQYLVAGGDVASPIGPAGDSSLMYVPGVEQRRGLYLFTTGVGFSYNAVIVSMPADTVATIDGLDVATTCEGPRADGTLDGVVYQAFECAITDGAHMVYSGTDPDEATTSIGVYVYSYYDAGSLAYPAGSDLRHTNLVVVD